MTKISLPLLHPACRPWTVKFDASPNTVHELHSTLRLNGDVIRTTVSKLPPFGQEPVQKFHKCKNLAKGTIEDTEVKYISSMPGMKR